MFNPPEYIAQRRRLPTSKSQQDIVTGDSINKKYNSSINLNSLILISILVILVYFNFDALVEKFATLTNGSHLIQNDLVTASGINTHDSTTTATSPTLLRRSNEQSIPIIATNPKINWDGCLYELPTVDKHKHIVPPPSGPITLVCCNTTAGVLNIEVHHNWAYNGATRFLHMVNSGFFSTKVGLFRALKNFLVQFGLAGDVEVQKKYHEMGNLRDDVQWLPPGPPGREINGIKRFQKGYLAYAGAGVHSRGTQLIMAFEDSLYLGGGSPWEVPWGQLFGDASYVTLKKIYTGYGEKVSQGKIMNRGNAYLEEEFPLLDYITQCTVTREGLKD